MLAFGLVIVFFASILVQESLAVGFSGHRTHVRDLLGSSDLSNLNLHTGFVDFSESRLNIHGERSTVTYHLKPHTTKLKVHVDLNCFLVKCYSGKFVLTQKTFHFASGNQPHDECLYSSVSAMTSSDLFNGRILSYNQKRPSLNDVQAGDLLRGNIECPNMVQMADSFKITSIHRQSDTTFGSNKNIYEINVRVASIPDIVSEGQYEFYTENLLTVNDVPKSDEAEQTMSARKLLRLFYAKDDTTHRLVDLVI
jgi:hypothetical protein